MKTAFTRLLSLLLCFAALFGLFPIPAAATEAEESAEVAEIVAPAVKVEESGAVVTTLEPITASDPVASDAAATKLGKAKSLKWNKEWDWYNQKLVTRYGNIAWKHSGQLDTKNPEGLTWYRVRLYRNDKLYYEQYVGYDNAYLAEDPWLTFDLSGCVEWKSGTYYFSIKAMSSTDKLGNGSTVKSGTWKYTKPSKKLDTPTNLRWNFPSVEWDPIDADCTYHVQCYYKPNQSDDMWFFHGQWKIQDTTNTPPHVEWEDPNIFGPGYYYFEVRAISNDITKVASSSWAEMVSYRFKMDTPEATISSTSSCNLKVKWNAVDFAEEYQVYRATSKSGEFKKVKTTSSLSFTDKDTKPGKTYYYKVRGVSYTGAKSSYSDVVSMMRTLTAPEVTAKNTASSGKVKLSWEKVSSAASYDVYRSDAEDGIYELVKNTTSTSYTDSSAAVGSTHYYKVVAVHEKAAANSAESNVVSGFRKLARPEVTVKVSSTTGYTTLSWNAVDGAESYAVYRATKENGTYERQITLEDTSYTDINASDNLGKKYYYKVVAQVGYDENDPVNSAKSEVVSSTNKMSKPVVEIELKNGDPRLDWNEVREAEKYYVYRATSKNGEYKKVKSTTKTAWTDTTAKAGKTYYYKVKAIHEKSAANSSYSSKVSIKAK